MPLSDVSDRVIEAVRLIVFALELLLSAARIALRKSVSLATLKVLSAIRGSSASSGNVKDCEREARLRGDRLRINMVLFSRSRSTGNDYCFG